MRTLKTVLLVVLLASSAGAAPKGKAHDKVTCEIDTIRGGHRVRLDPKDYTARQAVAIVTVVNKMGGDAFAVCGLETVQENDK